MTGGCNNLIYNIKFCFCAPTVLCSAQDLVRFSAPEENNSTRFKYQSHVGSFSACIFVSFQYFGAIFEQPFRHLLLFGWFHLGTKQINTKKSKMYVVLTTRLRRVESVESSPLDFSVGSRIQFRNN